MKTTGFLILNTISNICTFVTLALVLLILYYLKDNHDFLTKRQQNIKNTLHLHVWFLFDFPFENRSLHVWVCSKNKNYEFVLGFQKTFLANKNIN